MIIRNGIYIFVEEKQKLYLNVCKRTEDISAFFVEEKQKLYLNYVGRLFLFSNACWRETKVVFKFSFFASSVFSDNRWRETKVVFKFVCKKRLEVGNIVEEKQKLYLNLFLSSSNFFLLMLKRNKSCI